MATNIYKFGGSSQKDYVSLMQCIKILNNSNGKIVSVHSAPKDITDILYAAAYYKLRTNKFPEESFERVVARFKGVFSDVPGANILLEEQLSKLENKLIQDINEINWTVGDNMYAYVAKIAASGEDIEANMVEYTLNKLGISAERMPQNLILFKGSPLDSDYDNSSDKKIAEFIKNSKKRVVVMAGFIGVNPEGEFQVAGRGASDSTQTRSMNAYKKTYPDEKVVGYNCTDVPGVLEIDPRQVEEKDRKNIKIIPELNYAQIQNISLKGGKVLHSKSIEPLIEHNLELYVLNTFDPDNPEKRTRIYNKEMNSDGRVFAVTGLEKKFTSIKLQTGQMEGKKGYLAEFMNALKTVDVETASASGVEISASFHDNDAKVEEIKNELERLGKVRVEKDNSLIAIVGENIGKNPKIIGDFFNILGENNIPVNNIHKSNEVSLWVSIPTDYTTALRSVYYGMKDKDYFGSK